MMTEHVKAFHELTPDELYRIMNTKPSEVG